MNVTQVKNDNGSLSGILIPATDLTELKSSIRTDAPLYHYLEELITKTAESGFNQSPLINGLSVQETNQLAAKRTEDIYRLAFAKGVPMFYTDERCMAADQYIKANPDGSEDLVSYNIEKEEYTVLNNLLSAGKGQWSYLIQNQYPSNESTIHHNRGAEWGR